MPTAVPSIFPNLPEYLTKSIPEKRSETTSILSRFQKDYVLAEQVAAQFLESDKISSIFELNEKLQLEQNFPKNVSKLVTDEKIMFVSLKEDESGKPVIECSLTVAKDLNYEMWCKQISIPKSKVSHISKETIDSCSSVVNILAFLRNLCDQTADLSMSMLEQCANLLEKALPGN